MIELWLVNGCGVVLVFACVLCSVFRVSFAFAFFVCFFGDVCVFVVSVCGESGVGVEVCSLLFD